MPILIIIGIQLVGMIVVISLTVVRIAIPTHFMTPPFFWFCSLDNSFCFIFTFSFREQSTLHIVESLLCPCLIWFFKSTAYCLLFGFLTFDLWSLGFCTFIMLLFIHQSFVIGEAKLLSIFHM